MNPSSPYAARPWLEHYDYWVRPHLTYPRRALTEILDTAAVDLPDRPATAFLGAELTFQQIKDRSDPFAAALAGLGIAKGDRVGIMLPNCPQYIVAAFAVLRLGAIIVNVNPTYTAREVLTVANDSAMRVLITLDRLAPLAIGVRDQTRIEHIVVTSLGEYSAEHAAPPRLDGAVAFTDLLAGARNADVPRVSIDADDVAVLQYTGGTTGTPKGAMLTHASIFARRASIERTSAGRPAISSCCRFSTSTRSPSA
ncbi:MAG: hypothetical protein DMF91_11830 [Acidobacteria bacterium]|nr:MAG: hypothetical protein DMF91_11830 [Acidobacteriota bacterium]